jgi:hypothetical protein
MSTEAECPVMANCRRAANLGAILIHGSEALAEAHLEFGDHPNLKPAVEAVLSRAVDRLVAAARKSPQFAPTEQFHVETSEFRTAVRQAMAILFPAVEE